MCHSPRRVTPVSPQTMLTKQQLKRITIGTYKRFRRSYLNGFFVVPDISDIGSDVVTATRNQFVYNIALLARRIEDLELLFSIKLFCEYDMDEESGENLCQNYFPEGNLKPFDCQQIKLTCPSCQTISIYLIVMVLNLFDEVF